MNTLRRVIQQRNDLSEHDSERVERILRSYSERRITEREATYQLHRYVPTEAAALDLDDMLPMLLALLAGQQGQGKIRDLFNRFLDCRNMQGQLGGVDCLGDLIDSFLSQRSASSHQRAAHDADPRGLVDQLMNDGQQRSRRQNGDNDLFDIFDQFLGREQETPRSRNLRKRH